MEIVDVIDPNRNSSTAFGTVMSAPGNGTVIVNINGTTATIPHLRGYIPAVNDTVMVVTQGARRVVVDAVVNPSDPILPRAAAPAPSQPTPTAPVSPVADVTVLTHTFPAISTADFMNGIWRTDTLQPHMGNSGSGLNTGCWFYGNGIKTALNGATVTGAKIYLRRAAGGVYTSIAPVVYMVAQATRPAGAPTLIGTPVTLAPIPYDGEGWFDFPIALAQQLSNGTAFGIAVYVPGSNPFAAFSSLAERRNSGALQLTYSTTGTGGGGTGGGGGAFQYGNVAGISRASASVNAIGGQSATATVASWATVKQGSNVLKPAGTVGGDVLICIHWNDSDGNLGAMAAPSGWTLAASGSGSTGFWKVWWKAASGSEPTSYDFTTTATNSENASILLRCTGINTTTPFLTLPTSVSAASAALNHDAPSVSATAAGLLICCWETQVPVVANSWTVPGNMSYAGDLSQSADWLTAICAFGPLAANTASGVRTATATSTPAGSFGDIGMSMILAPSGTGGIGGGGGGSTPGNFMQGAAGVGVSDGNLGNWFTTAGTLQIAGAYANTLSAQTALAPVSTGGEYFTWTKAMYLSIGAIFKSQGETWAAAASGSYDARWTTSANNLKTAIGTRNAAYWFIAFAEQMNGNYVDWNVVPGEETNFKTAYGRWQNIIKGIIPTIKTVLVFNVSSNTGVNTDSLWPTVHPDVLGVDTFNAYSHITDVSGWTTKINLTEGSGQPAGLETWRAKAGTYGVPLAIAACGNPFVDIGGGAGGGDDPVWMQQLLSYCQSKAGTGAGQIIFAIYLNSGPTEGYTADYILYSDTAEVVHQPLNAAAFRQARSIGSGSPGGGTGGTGGGGGGGGTTSGFPSPVVGAWYYKYDHPTLGEIPSDAQGILNHIMAAFADSTSAGTGSIDWGGYNGYGSEAAFKADVLSYISRGKTVSISIGGSGNNGLIKLQNDTHRAQMFASIQSMVSRFGFNGVDMDMEVQGDWTPAQMAALGAQLKGYFGANFVFGLTMGLYGQLGNDWLAAAQQGGANVDYCAPMLYDFPEAGDSRLTQVAQDKINFLTGGGIDVHKIVLAFMLRVAGESYPNASPPAVADTAFRTAKANNPRLRGAFVWETSRENRDNPNWQFTRNTGAFIRSGS